MIPRPRGYYFVTGRRFKYKRALITVWLGAGRKPWRGLLTNPPPFDADIWHGSHESGRPTVHRWAKKLGAPQEVLDLLTMKGRRVPCRLTSWVNWCPCHGWCL